MLANNCDSKLNIKVFTYTSKVTVVMSQEVKEGIMTCVCEIEATAKTSYISLYYIIIYNRY